VSAKFTTSIDVQVACDDAGIPTDEIIQSWVGHAVSGSGNLPPGDVEVAVRVVDAEEIRTLNHLYRQKDKATNVLSFPAGEVEGLPRQETLTLGDLVVCASVVADEAAAQGKRLADHWGHMLVHGSLHLLGFGHETDAEAAEMEALEVSLLAVKGVADPYETT
jgi:probable rRNA maturation factor